MVQRIHHIRPGAIRIALPDTTQQHGYSCGAASLHAICNYYGVGPPHERDVIQALGMDRRIGSHPHQIKRVARRYGLAVREYSPMSLAQLRRELDRQHPVMVMIQAWGENGGRPRRDYQNHWADGHWVVAIGYDDDGVIFEDPSLHAVRGFLADDELLARWRDTGPRGRRMERYGLAVWRPRFKSSRDTQAVRIE